MMRGGRLLAGAIFLLVYALIFLLSSLPARSLPSGIPDVIPHFTAYFVLAFFFIQTFARPGRLPAAAAALAILALLGLLDEVHQLAVPGRFFSWLDLLYDTLGAAAGMAAYHGVGRWSDRLLDGKGRRWLDLLLLHR